MSNANGARTTSTGRAVLLMACLVLPWLNPLTGGPSAAVLPWLVSAGCAVIFWGFLTPVAAPGGAKQARIRSIAGAWLAAALISCVIALFQYFGLASHFDPFMAVTSVGEAFANLRQRNLFASLTMVGAAVVLWRVAVTDGKDRVALPAMLLLAVGNAASASRTGLVQLLGLAVLCAVWRGPKRRRRLALCLAAAAVYIAAALVLPPVLEALTGTIPANIWRRLGSREGCASRIVLWSNALHLIAEKPWLGWGWGELDYAHYMTLYPGPRFCDILDNAHNLPLHLATELGVPAAVIASGVFLWWVVRAKPWRETDPNRQLAWSVLAVILLHSMLEYPLWYGPFQIAFALSLGLLLHPLRHACPDLERCAPSAAPIQRVLALALIAALAFTSWDYRRISQIYLPHEARDAGYRDNTLERIRGSRLFRGQVRFAELTTTPLSPENAQWTLDTALAALHFSPEPRVIEKVIESAMLLGRVDEAGAHLTRFRAAFPVEHARWSAVQTAPLAPRPPPVRTLP